MAELIKALERAEKASERFFTITACLPCSVTEARTRFPGLKFDPIMSAIEELGNAEWNLANQLGMPELFCKESTWKCYHIARNSIRLGKLVCINS